MHLDNIEGLDGYTQPIVPRLPPRGIAESMGQYVNTPGGLTDFYFNPPTLMDNGVGIASGFGPMFPILPLLNPLQPIATTFNIDLNDGGGTGTGNVDSVNAGTLITVTGPTANPIVNVDDTSLCSWISTNCSLGNAFTTIEGDSGNTTADNSTDTLNIKGNNTSYLSTTASDTGTDQITVNWERRLFEVFDSSDGSDTVAADQSSSLGQTFTFTGAEGIKATARATEVDVKHVLDDATAPAAWYAFGTIVAQKNPTGDTDVETTANADSVGDSVKFVTTSFPDRSERNKALQITATDSPDVIDFKLVPQGHVGFGSQLVRVTSDGWTAVSLKLNGTVFYAARYTIDAFMIKPDSTNLGNGTLEPTGLAEEVEDTDSNQFLYDLAYNRATLPIVGGSPSGGTNATYNPSGHAVHLDPASTISKIEYHGFYQDDIVLAQRVNSNSYVAGAQPIIKVTCAS